MSLRLVITILVPCCWEKKEKRRGRKGEHDGGVMEVNPVSVKLYPELLTEITGTPGTVIIVIITFI